MKIQYKLGGAVAVSALVMNLLAPAAMAATTITISDNGKKSNNNVSVNNTSNLTLTQTNSLSVGLNINSKASTGGNKASGNTGGDVSIDTGKAVSTVNVTVLGGSNIATVEDCGCVSDDLVEILGNGKKSDNYAKVTNKKTKTATQVNGVGVGGDVKSKAKTGKNKANGNTNGTVDVKTDDATSEVTGSVAVGTNELTL